MFGTIRKQFLIQWRGWLWTLLIIFGGALSGIALHYFIILTDHETVSYIALGTVMACIVAVFLGGAMIVSQFIIYFDAEVSMGCTRSRFMVSVCAVDFLFMILYVAAAALINFTENALDRILYPGMSCEINLLPYFLKWGIPAAAFLCILCIFMGVLILRYGKKAFWVLWILWMLGCVGIPQIMEAAGEAPNSLFGRISRACAGIMNNTSIHTMIILGVLVCALSLGITWELIRKQQVTM